MEPNNKSGIGDYLQRLWERQRTNGLADLAGLDIAAYVPITQKVLDDLLRPLPLPDAVRNLRLIFAGNDLLRLEATVAVFLFKQNIRVEARVERYIPFPGDPVLKLTLLTGGVIELLLNVVTLPDFIRIEGKIVRIDLGMLLRRGGQEWLIGVLRDVKLNVHPGVAHLEARLVVPKPAPMKEF